MDVRAAVGALALLSLLPRVARATVESFLPYYVPYYHPQTGDLCLMVQRLLTEVGIPPASQMRASAAPTQTFTDVPKPHYVNINVAATRPEMVTTYVSDAVTPAGVWEYAMKLDVSA